MWTCQKCRSTVDDTFEVCWSCGTTIDGVEDPDFETADEQGPIDDPLDTLSGKESFVPDDEFGEPTYPELISCYMAMDTIEAQWLAEQLRAEGIPALADKHDLGSMIGGWSPALFQNGPCVRVRPQDLANARRWVEAYEKRKQTRT